MYYNQESNSKMSYIQDVLHEKSDRKQRIDGELEGRVADMATTSRDVARNNLTVYMYIM
jgi:hypothetical protein